MSVNPWESDAEAENKTTLNGQCNMCGTKSRLRYPTLKEFSIHSKRQQVYTGRKTALLGVIGLGTDETVNELGDDESYQHISVLQPISQILMPDLRRLQ